MGAALRKAGKDGWLPPCPYLVTHVPDEPILGALIYVVQSNGELNDAQAGAQMPAGLRRTGKKCMRFWGGKRSTARTGDVRAKMIAENGHKACSVRGKVGGGEDTCDRKIRRAAFRAWRRQGAAPATR